MPGGSELEVKLAVSDTRLFDLITTDPEIITLTQDASPVTLAFEALYYDTPNFALQKSGFAYRVRHEGEDWIATVKCDIGSGGGFSTREEWNEKVEGPEASRTPFAGTNVGDRLALVIGEEKLQLLFSTRFTRTILMLQTSGDAQVEMALDRGTIWSGMEGTPISELELELKKGSTSELLNLAGYIAARWHLLPEVQSKYARGLQLLQARLPSDSSVLLEKEPVEIRVPTAVTLVNACISNIFMFQTQLLARRATPEDVRLLRIQCRRLRSLLKFFQPTFSKDAGRLHIDRLRQWGTLLGSIRDIDVLVHAWQSFSTHFVPVFVPSENWLDILRERRDFLAEDIMHHLSQGELTQHIFELLAWLYQEEAKKTSLSEEQTADILVRKMLLESIKELREDIPAIKETVEIKILHRFRIRIKQLRYIQEALNGISRYRDEEFTASLKRLQSHIGKIHDAYQMKSLLDQFDAGNVDEKFLLEKELFVSWRARGTIEALAALSKDVDLFRRVAKLRLRALAALRANRGTKLRHDSCAHEPSE